MSVSFRQRTPAEYGRILWKRKWLIILPTIAIAFATAWAVRRLPNIYESTTLLAIRPPSISPSVVKLSEMDLTRRINDIGQLVLSRSSLEPMIVRHNLYAAERARGEATELLIEQMKTKDIKLTLNSSRDDTNGFNISFLGPDPTTTQRVAAELASKYIDEQLKATTRETGDTESFFSEKLQRAKEDLDAIDQQRVQFMTSNAGTLPSAANSLLGQLAGLREQQKSFMTEIGRMRDQSTMLQTQKGDIAKQRTREIDDYIDAIGDPKTSPGYAELIKSKTQLEAQRTNLLLTLRPKHPDVISVQTQIDSIEGQMAEMVKDHERRVADREKKLASAVDPRLQNIDYSLQMIRNETQRMQSQLAQGDAQIAQINSQLSGAPQTEVGLEVILREYSAKKAAYDDMRAQQQRADLVKEVATTQRGETIEVLDAANTPSRPVAPKRPVLIAMGVIAGLAVGFLCAALFEVPRLLTIQTKTDAEHYTGLPVLAMLPEMLTPREERSLKLRRMAFAFAGVIVAVASVPALIILLRVTRLLELVAYRA